MIPVRAALRNRLIRAASAVPLRWPLAALAAMRGLVDVDRLPAAQAAADAFGLRGAARLGFCRRVWWGAKAGELVASRLKLRPAEVMSRVTSVDLDGVARAAAAGRGVLLAAVHLGPNRVAANAVRERFPETLFLLREGWTVAGPARVIRVDEDANRGAALVEARRHLRGGGLVYAAPDGITAPHPVRVPLRRGWVPMGRGVATLARLAGSPAFPITAAWIERRIHVLVGSAIEPRPASADGWDLEWLTLYLAALDRWASGLAPENLRLHGSIYERWIRPGTVDGDGRVS